MFMAPAPGSTSNSSVHLPPITADVDVLSRTESAELRTAWQWWQTLFTTAANTFVHSLHLEPEHDHYRLRSRSASTLDEELLQTSEPLKTAISALIEQCWGKQVARHARHQRHLQLSWQQSRLYISVDCIETNRGTRTPSVAPHLTRWVFATRTCQAFATYSRTHRETYW